MICTWCNTLSPTRSLILRFWSRMAYVSNNKTTDLIFYLCKWNNRRNVRNNCRPGLHKPLSAFVIVHKFKKAEPCSGFACLQCPLHVRYAPVITLSGLKLMLIFQGWKGSSFSFVFYFTIKCASILLFLHTEQRDIDSVLLAWSSRGVGSPY